MVIIREINLVYAHNTVALFRIRLSATNMGIQLFNKLPVQIKQLNNYKGFKREGKTFLSNNLFYMIEEFFGLWENIVISH